MKGQARREKDKERKYCTVKKRERQGETRKEWMGKEEHERE